MSEQCPQCGERGGTLRARQAYEGDPPALEVSPPAAPPVTRIATAEPRWNPGTRAMALIVGCYLLVALVAVLGAEAAGMSGGAVLAGVPLPGVGFFVVLHLARSRAPRPEANAELVSYHKRVWTKRMQAWENAWFCTGCRVAFWPPRGVDACLPRLGRGARAGVPAGGRLAGRAGVRAGLTTRRPSRTSHRRWASGPQRVAHRRRHDRPGSRTRS